MTVSELIAHLQKQPQHLLVAFDLYSEHMLMRSRTCTAMQKI